MIEMSSSQEEAIVNANSASEPNRVMSSRSQAQLEVCLSQYDIISNIANYSTSIDLFSLARISKSAWNSIKSTDSLWRVLTSKTTCCGFGVTSRIHRLISNSSNAVPDKYLADEYMDSIRCGSTIPSLIDGLEEPRRCINCNYCNPSFIEVNDVCRPPPAESQLCVDCGSMTCNECRIHCSYRFPVDCAPGIQLFAGDDKCIGNSRRCIPDGPLPAKRAFDSAVSCLRQAVRYPGAPVTPEEWYQSIEDIIEVDLGHDTDEFHPDILDVVRARQIAVCMECCSNNGPGMQAARERVNRGIRGEASGDVGGYFCECTLKKRYVDAWRCMRCFRANDFRKNPDSGSASDPDYFMDAFIMDCGCGAETVRMIQNYLLVCKWCGGSIRRPRGD